MNSFVEYSTIASSVLCCTRKYTYIVLRMSTTCARASAGHARFMRILRNWVILELLRRMEKKTDNTNRLILLF